jgi:hypothetical protein
LQCTSTVQTPLVAVVELCSFAMLGCSVELHPALVVEDAAEDAAPADVLAEAMQNAPEDATVEADARREDGAARTDGDTGHADGDASETGVDAGISCSTDAGHPTELACTGLYASWPARTIAPEARAYAPGLALWSDGAEKRRYIALPHGSKIDTSAMDEWAFPVGTKIWKEFRLGGRPVETRFLWKRAPGDWFRTTYAWSADGSSAAELTTGAQGVAGTSYEIPSQEACTTCHQGRVDGVLGFEAVSLAAPGATGLNMAALVSEGRLTSAPAAPLTVPGDAAAAAALGWLHANCGTACHNRSPAALAGSTGLFMRLEVAQLAAVQTTDTWLTAVGQPSGFQPASDAGLLRIAPGDPSHSAVYFRDSSRDDQGQGLQMPPIDTHVAPDVSAERAWILAIK